MELSLLHSIAISNDYVTFERIIKEELPKEVIELIIDKDDTAKV